MEREDTKKILDILIRAYPNHTFIEDDADFDLWVEIFEDMDFTLARQATITVIRNNKGYPPGFGDIREIYNDLEEEKRKIRNEIRTSYEGIKSYYPGSGEANYGWGEFKARAKTPDQARALSQMIFSFVRKLEEERADKVPDFAEVIRTVRREGETIITG